MQEILDMPLSSAPWWMITLVFSVPVVFLVLCVYLVVRFARRESDKIAQSLKDLLKKRDGTRIPQRFGGISYLFKHEGSDIVVSFHRGITLRGKISAKSNRRLYITKNSVFNWTLGPKRIELNPDFDKYFKVYGEDVGWIKTILSPEIQHSLVANHGLLSNMYFKNCEFRTALRIVTNHFKMEFSAEADSAIDALLMLMSRIRGS